MIPVPYDTHSYASIFIINEGSLKISWGKKPKHTVIDLHHRKNSALYIQKNDSFFSVWQAAPGKWWLFLGPSLSAEWLSRCSEKSHRID